MYTFKYIYISHLHSTSDPTPKQKNVLQISQIMDLTHCNTTLPEEGRPSRLFSKLILAICMPWIPSFVCGYTV